MKSVTNGQDFQLIAMNVIHMIIVAITQIRHGFDTVSEDIFYTTFLKAFEFINGTGGRGLPDYRTMFKEAAYECEPQNSSSISVLDKMKSSF